MDDHLVPSLDISIFCLNFFLYLGPKKFRKPRPEEDGGETSDDDESDDKDVDNNVEKVVDNVLDDSLFEIPPHFVEDPSRWSF